MTSLANVSATAASAQGGTFFPRAAQGAPEMPAEAPASGSARVYLSERAQALAQRFQDENPDHDNSLFSKLVANRLKPVTVAAFNDNDRKLLGEAYRLTGGDEKDMEKLDRLTIELGALRIQQRLTGELIASASGKPLEDRNGDGEVNSDDARYEVDFAHLPILGEMKRMATKRHMAIELF
ncbi:MAG: hypothetical protein LBF93_11770 [Zoogloeaceae bacterium]|jgi:hypothetical protein|nr:hypothetical protein [Zoogloeaceae bacterium]